MKVNYRAAWVPEQEYRDWDDAAAIAIAHVEQECAEHGIAGLLVTETKDGARGIPSLERFVARHGFHESRRSAGWRARRVSGPTLVYVPYADLLEVAVRYVRDSSLCAVETSSFRLSGWAAATAATNLDTGEPTLAPAGEALALLEHLEFVGNNAWGDAYGKRDARRLLTELRGAEPALDADYIAGYMIGKGRSAAGAKRLHAMIGKLA